MPDLFENPMGLDGFEFVEFASPEPGILEPVFHALGFEAVARHRSKKVTLYRQGGINFILNEEPQSQAAYFAQEHGPCAGRHGISSQGRARRLHTGAGTRRTARRNTHRPDGTAPSRHQGYRWCAACI